MGARKSIRAEKLKAEKKQKAIAVLNDCPTSPLKMRIVADLIRGVEINKALGILRYSKKQASIRLEKLVNPCPSERKSVHTSTQVRLWRKAKSFYRSEK